MYGTDKDLNKNMKQYKYTLEDVNRILNTPNQANMPMEQAPTKQYKYTVEDVNTILNTPSPEQETPSFLQKAGDRAKTFAKQMQANAMGLQEGLFFGLDDNIQAGVQSIFDPSTTYKQALESARQQRKELKKDFPVEYTTGNVAGAIANPALPLKVAKGASIAQNVGQGFKVGAKGGTISGYGYSEADNVEDKLKDSVAGGAMGATLGAGFGLGSQLVGAGYKGAKSLAKGVKNVALGGGKNADKAIVQKSLGMNPEEARNKLLEAKSLGLETSLSEVVEDGSQLQSLLGAVARNVEAKPIVTKNFTGRTKDSYERISKFLDDGISSKEHYDNINLLIKKRAEEASPLYEKAKNVIIPNSKDLDSLLEDQRIQKAIKIGKVEYGVNPKASNNSLEALDGAKKAIDDIMGKAKKDNKSNKVKAYKELKDKLVKIADEASPDYKKARQIYSDESSLINAQEEGLNFLQGGMKPQELNIKLKDYSVAEKEAFKIGVKKKLLDQAGEVIRGNDTVSKARLLSVNMEQKLKALLGKGYGKFMKQINLERKLFQTKNKILAGSQTASRLQEDSAFPSMASKVMGDQSLPRKILDLTTDFIGSRWSGVSDKNARNIARFLTEQDKGIEFLDEIIKKSEPKQRLILKDILNDFLSLSPATKITTQQSSSALGSEDDNNNLN